MSAADLTAVAELWRDVLDRAAALSPRQLELPTPCEDWTVADILRHLAHQAELDGAEQAAVPEDWRAPEGAAPRDVWSGAGVAARQSWDGPRILEALRDAAERHLDRIRRGDWSAPDSAPAGMPVGTEGFHVRTRAFDLWVHLADIAVACGGEWPLRDTSAGAAVAGRKVVELLPYILAHRAELPEAGLRLRLGAPLDLDTVVGPEGAAPLGGIAGSPSALALFVAGRVSADDCGDLLAWTGEAGQAVRRQGVIFASA